MGMARTTVKCKRPLRANKKLNLRNLFPHLVFVTAVSLIARQSIARSCF